MVRISLSRVVRSVKSKVFPKALNLSLATILALSGIFSAVPFLFPSSAAAINSPSVVYDATPSSLPPNVASVGFQATSTSEFGDYIHLGGANRALRTITVTMSDWALASNPDNIAFCSALESNCTVNGFNYPITLNVYGSHLGANGAPDTLLATKTQVFNIAWRPEATTGPSVCTDPTAYRAGDGSCYSGIAQNITFDLSSNNVTLPNDVILGVAYNTQSYGTALVGQPGPYNSLNVGVPTSQTASVGTDDNADNVFWNTSHAGFYTDGGQAGVGILRQDTVWTPNGTVAFQITAAPVTPNDVYVNSSWGTVPAGQDPDGSGGPATQMGYDAFSTIQAGLTAVAAGGTITVSPGTGPYIENLTINKAVSLLGPNAGVNPNTTSWTTRATLTGQILITASNVSVKGLTITDPSYAGPTIKGVQIFNTGPIINGVTIQNNEFTNIQNGAAHGAYAVMVQSNVSDINVLNNRISGIGATVSGGWAHAIEVTPSSGSTAVPQNVTITGNAISNVTNVSSLDAYAFSVDESSPTSIADASQVTFQNNNLSELKVRNLDPNHSLNATDNWWGTSDKSTIQGLISANVNFEPYFTDAGMTTLESTGSDVSLQETSDGVVGLPDGVTDLALSNDTNLDVHNSVNDVSGGNVVTGSGTQDLTNYTGGDLGSGVNLDLAQLVGDQQVTVAKAVTLQSGDNSSPITLTNTDLSDVTVEIPNSTTVLAPSSWNGTITPPTSSTDSSGTAPSGFSVGSTIIEVGAPHTVLLFDKAVTITLTGVTGQVGYRPADSTVWIQITTTCGGTYALPTDPTFPGECAISDGTNTKILTYHFTSFAGLNVVPASNSGSSNSSSSSSSSSNKKVTLASASTGSSSAAPVLGATTTTPATGTSTLSTRTTKPSVAVVESTKTTAKLLGLNWYWWIAILVVMAGVGVYYAYYIADITDRKNSSSK